MIVIKKWAKMTDLDFEGKLMNAKEVERVKVLEPGVPGVHCYFVLVPSWNWNIYVNA